MTADLCMRVYILRGENWRSVQNSGFLFMEGPILHRKLVTITYGWKPCLELHCILYTTSVQIWQYGKWLICSKHLICSWTVSLLNLIDLSDIVWYQFLAVYNNYTIVICLYFPTISHLSYMWILTFHIEICN